MNIIKRNGEEVPFNGAKIVAAIHKANAEVEDADRLTDARIDRIASQIEGFARTHEHALNVEEIQDLVETKIMEAGGSALAKKYIKYRFIQEQRRQKNSTDGEVLTLVNGTNEEIKQENSNKNPTVASTQRDYIAGAVSKDISKRILLPEDVVRAHNDGLIHFHDMDYYLQTIPNCCLANLDDMLQNGTVIAGNYIDRPKSFLTACTVATQIAAAVASNQYGGQTMTYTHLAPFVDVSRQKIRRHLEEAGIRDAIGDDKFDSFVEDEVRREIKAGVQTIQYQVSTIATSNGQAPFITFFMYLNEARNEREKADLVMIIEEVLKQRIEGVKNDAGLLITPAFPKLIYVLQEDNVVEGSKYWHLTELAAKCTAKRLVPDYISEKKMLEYKKDDGGVGHCYPCMGCRSFLTVPRGNVPRDKFYGRFNQGVVSVNLPDIALSSGRDFERFWQIFDERMQLCHKALQCRHNRLRGVKSDVSPIHWQHGALARLAKGETIDKLLFGGYSTISLGYIGLWECVYYMSGKKLTEPEGERFGLEVMHKLNEYTARWKADENIDYSLYGTPAESLCYRFAKTLQKRFGIVEGVTDRSWITNSYHIHVTEKVDAFTKLETEAKFQRLSPGGAISYVEVPNMQNNIPGVLAIMKFIYDNIQYAELNTKSDVCSVCGYSGEIKTVKDDNGKLVWECPKCGNRDQSKMSVVRRTCGYIGSQFWNEGKTAEIAQRVLHVD